MLDAIKRIQFQKLMAFGALIILYLFFAHFGRNFVSVPTTLNILAISYFVGFLAIGVTFVIITGGIDLSIGAVMVCSSLVGALLYRDFGVPLWICLIFVVLTGIAFGIFNGMLVTRLKLPPFIATLGTMLISLGLGSIMTNSRTMTYPTIIEADAWFGRVFLRNGSFPSGLMFLAAFVVVASIVLNKTKLGRYVFAIGSNEEAVRLSGVKAHNWKCAAYIISGFFAGVGAIFYSAFVTTITPNTGQGFELDAIAAAVIGGTSLAGGVGSISGTMVGVFIMSTINAGFVSMGLPAPYRVFFTGVVVIGAVLMDIQRNKKANEVKKVG